MSKQTYEYAYEAIGDLLVENEVEKLFTLMSDGTIGLLTDLVSEHNDDLDIVYNRHESSAVAMADGYSRATGEIAVAVVGRGAALTNTTTSLTSATKKGSKVLLILPKEPLNLDKDKPSKKFDQNGLLKSVVGGAEQNRYVYGDRVVDLNSQDTLINDLEKIFWRLERGEGPIAVQVPYDVLNDKGEIVRTQSPDFSSELDEGALGVLTPDQRKVEEAIDLYLDADTSSPPGIIAGQGVMSANAKEEVLTFAERTNAILTTTMQSRGLFADHPYSAGTAGGFGSLTAHDYLLDADFILAVGCSLNHHQTDKGKLVGEGDNGSKIVHIDTDLGILGRYTDVNVAIHGDAKATLEAMNAKLEERSIHQEDVFWNDQTKRRIKNAHSYMDPDEFKDEGDRIDPRQVVNSLNDFVSEDRIVLHDTGHHQFWALEMDVNDPADFIWTKDFVGVGEGVKMGLGAALDNSRTSVVFCGDGGIMMSLPIIETAARHEIPVIIVVMNDRALGAEYHRVVERQLPTPGSQIETPDLGSVAESLGAEGYTIREQADLERLEDKLSHPPDGPILLNCEVSRDVFSPRGK